MYTHQFWPSYVFSAVEFSANGNMITLHGIRPHYFYNDIRRIWSSSKPVSYIAGDNVGSSYIKFEKFYLYDVYFILNKMKELHRKLRLSTSLNHITTAIKEMQDTVLKSFFSEPTSLFNNPKGFDVFNKKPYPRQKEFFDHYSSMKQRMGLRGYLLDAEPGTGKTATSLMLMEMVDGGPTMVVCPIKAMNRAWEKTIVEELTVNKTYWLSTGNKPLRPGYDYYIVHNEYARKLVGELQANKMVIKKIIVDECHNFNEYHTEQTQGLITSCDYLNPTDILFMSGTPFKAMGKELSTMLRCIDPSFNDKIASNISKTFGKSSKGWLEIIANRIGLTSFKITADVKGEAPIHRVEKIKLPDGKRYTLTEVRNDIKEFVTERVNYYTKHGKEYETFFWSCVDSVRGKVNGELLERYIAGVRRLQAEGYDQRIHSDLGVWLNGFEKKVLIPALDPKLKERFKDAKTVVKYVALKIQGEALGRILGRRRIECFVDIATHANYRALIDGAEKKTIIFASHVSATEKAFEVVRALGYKPALVHGEHTKIMPEIVKQFFEDPKLNPLIATYDSMSEAVPLYCANHVVLLNPPFRDYEENQAVSRAARLGQDTQVYVTKYILDTGKEDNLSSRTLDILKWSKEQVAILTGKPITSDEYNLESADLYVKRLHSSSPEMDVIREMISIESDIDFNFKPARLRW